MAVFVLTMKRNFSLCQRWCCVPYS